MAMVEIGLEPDQYSEWGAPCLAYIGENSGQSGSLFAMGKGREGGVARTADLRLAVSEKAAA